MKKCKKCGEIFESDDSLCVYCGGKLVEIAEDSVEEESEFFDVDSPRERKIATKAEKIKTLGAILLAAAAFFALVLTIFTGQSVKYVGKTRNADPSAFSYFSDKNMLDYLQVSSVESIRSSLEDSGLYVTDSLVEAYRAISITQTVAAIVMIVCVCGFFALAVYQTVCAYKNGFKKPKILGYAATVVSYVCGAFVFQTIESGRISVVYKIKNTVADSFGLSYGLNAITVVGLIVVLLLMFGGLALLVVSNASGDETSEKTLEKAQPKRYKNPVIVERITACVVAACALISVGFAASSAVTSSGKGTAAVYNKNEATGNYERVEYATENGDDLTLIALVQKYSLDEEDLLYKISVCEAKIKENDQDVDSKVQLNDYNTQLENIRSLMKNALNFGLTTIYVNVALIIFAGVLICFAICGRRIQKGDLLIGVGVAVAFFAFLGCLISIFVMVAFAQLGVNIFNIAPIFHLLFSVGALVAAFYTRKYTQRNLADEQGVQKDVTI